MARNLQPKMVQCYHCDHRFEVGGRAQSTSCPGCNKPLMVADQEINGQRGPIRELKTCGQIIVKKRGRLICQHIVAHNGLICEGIIDAKKVESRLKVILGPKSTFKGDLTAPAVDINEGARIQPSYFSIGPPIQDADAPPQPPPPEPPPDQPDDEPTPPVAPEPDPPVEPDTPDDPVDTAPEPPPPSAAPQEPEADADPAPEAEPTPEPEPPKKPSGPRKRKRVKKAVSRRPRKTGDENST